MKTILALAALVLLAGCVESTTGGSDGGTGGTGGATPVACTDCIAEVVSWGPNGGLVAYTQSSALTSCRTYTHTQTPAYDSTAAYKTCSVEIGGCDAGPIAIHDVEEALAHPDVLAALAGTTPLYGTDPRPCDGSVLEIKVGSRSVLVGGECAGGFSCGSSSCVAVPPGLRALADLLGDLDQQAQKIGECAQTFP